MYLGQCDLARSFLERAEALGERATVHDPVFVARLLVARGAVDFYGGSLAQALSGLSRAREAADRAGDGWSRGLAPSFHLAALGLVADCDRMEATAREITGFPESTFLIDYSALSLAHVRAFAHGARRCMESIAPLRALLERQDKVLVDSARGFLAPALVATGAFEEAEREATTLLEQGLALSWPRSLALAALALVALHRDQPADALAFAERGLDAARSGMRHVWGESVLQLARAEALYALGSSPDAFTAIRQARDRVLGIAATLEPDDRTSYLTNVDANARTLALAKEWLGE
jgi:hypothetical protein